MDFFYPFHNFSKPSYFTSRHYECCVGNLEHRECVSSCSFSPTNQNLAVSVSDDFSIKVRNFRFWKRDLLFDYLLLLLLTQFCKHLPKLFADYNQKQILVTNIIFDLGFLVKVSFRRAWLFFYVLFEVEHLKIPLAKTKDI